MPGHITPSRLHRSFLRKKWRSSSKKDNNGNSMSQAAYSAVQKVIRGLADTLDGVPAPGLQGVIRGILFIMDNLDLATQNLEDFRALQAHLESCQSIFNDYKCETLPAAVKEAMMTLSESVNSVSGSLTLIVGRCRVRRIWASSEDAQIFMSHVRTISNALARFQVATSTFVAVQSSQSLAIDRQLLMDRLKNLPEAHYNSRERKHVPSCLEHTRVSVLRRIKEWAHDPSAPSTFWLHGAAGTGKTTIAQSIADSFAKDGHLAGHFFFSRDKSSRLSADGLFTTLIHQLCNFEVRLIPILLSAVLKDSSLSTARSNYIFSRLLVQPLLQLKSEVTALLFPMVVVVDALDECKEVLDAASIVSNIVTSRLGRKPRPLLKFLVTSRLEGSIRTAFEEQRPKFPFVELDLGAEDSRGDVDVYFRKGFKDIRAGRPECFRARRAPWPETYALNRLLKKSAGLFIYASTTLNFVSDAHEHPLKQLKLILDTKSRQRGLHGELDSLYRHVVSRDPFLERVHAVVGTVILAHEPLSMLQIEVLLGLDEGDAYTTLRSLQSVIIVPTDDTQPIRLFHPSFHDFLTTKERAEEVYLNPAVQNAKLAQACMSIVRTGYPKWMTLGEAGSAKRNLFIYACRYWPYHLCRADSSDALIKVLEEFLYSHTRIWLETFIQLELLNHLLNSLSEIFRSTLPNLRPDLCEFLCHEIDRFGVVIATKYLHLRYIRPLALAEGLHERAIGHFPKDRPSHFKYHYGRVLRRVYQQSASRNDLTAALKAQEDVMRALTYHDHDSAVYMIEMAVCYRIQYRLGLDPEMARLSEALLQSALSVLPDDDVNKSICYNSYGFLSLVRFDVSKSLTDLSRAIRSFQSASKCPTISSTQSASYLYNVGVAFSMRFAELGDDEDAIHAIQALTTAAHSPAASPSVSFQASLELARCQRIRGEDNPLPAFVSALLYGRNLVLTSLPDDDAKKLFKEAIAGGYEGAVVAMERGDMWNVIDCIDQACSIFWRGGLCMGTPLFPIDADQSRIQALAIALEGEGGREPVGIPSSDDLNADSINIPQLRSEYDQLTKRTLVSTPLEVKLEHLIGTESVLQLSSNRVIILGADHTRSFALVLQAKPSQRVVPIPLRVSQAQLQTLAQDTRNIWNGNWTSLGVDGKAVLQQLWDLIVADIVTTLDAKAGHRPPRTWWCTSGVFMDLPIHAAVNYRRQPREHLTDYMISSYIPSVSCLFDLREKPILLRQPTPTLLCLPPAPNPFFGDDAKLDLPAILNVVPESSLSTLSGRISLGLVFSQMRDCLGVHIPCPSQQRGEDPVDGRFSLPDDVYVELKQLFVQPTLPKFAYLSTYPITNAWAKGPPTCRLAYDCLTLGFSSVVAHQCSIPQTDSATLASYFYAELLKDGTLDFDIASSALHFALVKLREECDATPKPVWVRAIHVGM